MAEVLPTHYFHVVFSVPEQAYILLAEPYFVEPNREHLDPVHNLKWVVYAKPPFAGPQQVVNYVGRYTHRVAISNHRIVDIEGGAGHGGAGRGEPSPVPIRRFRHTP